MVKAIAILLGLLISVVAEARVGESICVKYGPCPLDLSAFICTDMPRSSFVRRIFYDAPKAFMVINLSGIWYPYCQIGPGTVQALITAEHVGSFYNQTIRSRRYGARGPFDCRDHLVPNY